MIRCKFVKFFIQELATIFDTIEFDEDLLSCLKKTSFINYKSMCKFLEEKVDCFCLYQKGEPTTIRLYLK